MNKSDKCICGGEKVVIRYDADWNEYSIAVSAIRKTPHDSIYNTEYIYCSQCGIKYHIDSVTYKLDMSKKMKKINIYNSR